MPRLDAMSYADIDAAGARCDWAACHRPMKLMVEGWAMCYAHHRLHLQLLREDTEKPCAGCGEEFETDDPRRTKCDGCRRVRVDKRPSHAKRQKAA